MNNPSSVIEYKSFQKKFKLTDTIIESTRFLKNSKIKIPTITNPIPHTKESTAHITNNHYIELCRQIEKKNHASQRKISKF